MTWREGIIHGALLLCLLAMVFPGTFLRGEMIVPGDVLYQWPPWNCYRPEGWEKPNNPLATDPASAFHNYYVQVRQSFDAGEWPLWNPYQLYGTPLLANYQTTVFYPPRLLHQFMDTYLATTLLILLKLWLCGVTAYLCARGMKFGPWPARFFSMAWMLNAYNVCWGCWPLPDVSAWVPIVFLGVEWALDARYRKAFWTIATGGTLLLLAGHPESAFAAASGIGFYFVLRLVFERRRGRQLWMPTAVCAAAWIPALLLCAAQIIPFLEYVTQSAAVLGQEREKVLFYLTPSMLISFWIPRFFGTEADGTFWGALHSNLYGQLYPGLLIWFGISLLAWRRPQPSEQRARQVCLAITSGLLILLAFQVPGEMLTSRTPLIRHILGVYYITFALFALPLLGTIGLERWLSARRPVRELLRPLTLIAVVGIVAMQWYRFNEGYLRMKGYTSYVQDHIMIAAGFAAAGFVVLVISHFWHKPRISWAVMTCVLAADLLTATWSLNTTMPERLLYPETALTRFLRELGPVARICVETGGTPGGYLQGYGIEELFGYDGIYPARPVQFHRKASKRYWETVEPVAAVTYYLHNPRYKEPLFPVEPPGLFSLIGKYDGVEVYRNNRACPRAFLVGRLAAVDNMDDLFEYIQESGYDPKRTAVTDQPPKGPLPDSDARDVGSAAITLRSGTHVSITADAKAPCVLVLADTYYPGWKAYVDGAATEVFPVYHAFRGVLLQPGPHTVEFEYFPWTFRLGLTISVLTMIAGILVAVRQLRRQRSLKVALRQPL